MPPVCPSRARHWPCHRYQPCGSTNVELGNLVFPSFFGHLDTAMRFCDIRFEQGPCDFPCRRTPGLIGAIGYRRTRVFLGFDEPLN